MMVTMFDEYQGLTADMVRGWLLAQGWEITDTGNGNIDVKKRFTDRSTVLGCQWETCFGWLLSRVAAAHGLNMQSLLREINPRMRKGWPSDEAVRAHTQWLAQSGPTGHIICGLMAVDSDFGPCLKSRTARLDKTRAAEWLFWPCDANGNKVRWPEKDGVML